MLKRRSNLKENLENGSNLTNHDCDSLSFSNLTVDFKNPSRVCHIQGARNLRM